MEGAGVGIGDVSDIARLLLIYGLVFWVAFSYDLEAWRAAPAGSRPVRATHAHAPIGRSSET
jgi:hypothetical protein